MNRQEAKIKLLARLVVILLLVILTTAESCENANVEKFFQSAYPVEETRIAGQTKTRAAEQTKEALLALLPVSPSSGQVTTIPLPTNTTTPTFTPLPSATATRTPVPSATSTTTPTPTPPPLTSKYIDPMNDCFGYQDGTKKDCPLGRDITDITVTYSGARINLSVTIGGDVTQSVAGALTVRYSTEPGSGKLVSDTITYRGVENGIWWLGTYNPTGCKQEPGSLVLSGQPCTVSNNGHQIQVQIPVHELIGATDPILFRVFTTLYASPDPDIPVDSFPEVDKLLRLSPKNQNLPYHPLFNDVVWK
jgi:hypothetical protein